MAEGGREDDLGQPLAVPEGLLSDVDEAGWEGEAGRKGAVDVFEGRISDVGGKVTWASPSQLSKAPTPIWVRLGGRVTWVSPRNRRRSIFRCG